MNKKKEFDRLCKCGHREGEHTYHKGSFCTNDCTCKEFNLTNKFMTRKGIKYLEEGERVKNV